MIVVTGRLRIAPENRDRFIELASEMCRRSRQDEGCVGYRFYSDLEQPDHYVIVEEWRDEEALQLHFRQPHTGVFMGGLPELLAAAPDALFHTVAQTRRLDPARGLVPID
jgi:quinol monooxygenase YgiN